MHLFDDNLKEKHVLYTEGVYRKQIMKGSTTPAICFQIEVRNVHGTSNYRGTRHAINLLYAEVHFVHINNYGWNMRGQKSTKRTAVHTTTQIYFWFVACDLIEQQ